MANTTHERIVALVGGLKSNWKDLFRSQGEPVLGKEPRNYKVLANFIHLSDLHICDAQSPARLEFLDRIADPDNPLSAMVPYVGTYRAQEFLTAQVLEAMVVASNEITAGPLTGARIDAVVVTGDVTDNAQTNELRWYKTILDGGLVVPNSGSMERSEGSHSSNPDNYDPHYYHPDGPPEGKEADRPHTLHGFPHFHGVVESSEAPFIATGLQHKWLAVHGNHDALLQGTAAPTADLEALITGDQKLSGFQSLEKLGEMMEGFGEVGPALYPGLEVLDSTKVTADSGRTLSSIEKWVEVHTECAHDHGLEAQNKETAFYYRDFAGGVRLIALDTVNPWGGWQGCIDRNQFKWLEVLLENSRDKYVVLTSHHPLKDLFNGYVPSGVEPHAVKEEVTELLIRYPNVILWFSGHVHDHKISEVLNARGDHAFWEIRTGSHIDWPQQSRTIEIVKGDDGTIAIGTTIYDHAGPLEFSGTKEELNNPVALAGLSRLLAANDWQRQSGPYALSIAEGTHHDRNIWLWADDPLI
jgi:metallophosphoesterase (TIGR03767 family)